MPKQLYIPLPCAAARQKMVQHVLGSRGTVRAELSEQDLCKARPRGACNGLVRYA